jgi:hypothetical protein
MGCTEKHVPVGDFITYPNIQISAFGNRDSGIAEIIQRAGCTDHDGPALGSELLGVPVKSSSQR